MPLAAGLAIGGISSLVGGIFGANAASNAADTQANAANNAAQLQSQAANNALNFQKQQYGNSLQMAAPWLASGSGAASKLSYLMGIPGVSPLSQQSIANGFGSSTNGLEGINPNLLSILRGQTGGNSNSTQLMSAAGAMQAGNNGGSAFVPNGTPSATNPAASGGSSLVPFAGGPQSFPPGGITQSNGGGTAQVPGDPNANGVGGGFGSLLTPYGHTFQAPTDVTEQNDPGYQFRLQQGMQALQNSAAARGGLLSGGTAKSLNDYAQGSASNEYQNVYNRALTNFQTGYNQYNNDQNTIFNRLASLSGQGQTQASQLSSAGQGAANNVSNILLGSAGQQGQDLQNAGAARGSGYVGGANALSGALGGIGNTAILASLLGNQGGSNTNSLAGFADPNTGGFCWIAEELYGIDSPKTHAIRAWLKDEYSKTPVGERFVDWYQEHGESVAEKIKHDPDLRDKFQSLFDKFAEQAMPSPMEDFESVRYQR